VQKSCATGLGHPGPNVMGAITRLLGRRRLITTWRRVEDSLGLGCPLPQQRVCQTWQRAPKPKATSPSLYGGRVSRDEQTDGGLYGGYRGTRRSTLYCERLLGRRFLRGHRRIYQTEAAHAHSSSISPTATAAAAAGPTAASKLPRDPSDVLPPAPSDCNNLPSHPDAALRRTPLPQSSYLPRSARGPGFKR